MPSPVLFVNGCGLPARCWDEVVGDLGERCLTIDRPGFDATRWDGLIPKLRDDVAQLAALLTEPTIVVAHSMGAFRAEALARTHPDKVSGLVLVDPSVVGRRPPFLVPGQVLARIAGWLLRVAPMRWLVARSVRAAIQLGARRPLGDWACEYDSAEALASATAEWLAYGRQSQDLKVLRRFRPLPKIPVTVLWAPPRPKLGALKRAIGDFAQVAVSESGHLVMVDRPDVVLDAITRMDHLAGLS